ncbi:MAG: tRNA (guanosine(37)-N1)-methyltransferase TrmD [Bacteroidetes bacterium HGW-Bacteroidetes-6]|jgi:tRNA (guanine37-N1)-methyltransferase|nr:MAG: tRNA (guanosine(37)-N1)-methyltransferase TrmD [Bacteroidetes bacterium HGW-Bacteroidetes-6]
MRIDILSLFPEMFQGPFSESIVKRALQKGLAEIFIHNIRNFSTDKHHRVDDYQFGGGAGMVMMPEPVVAAIESLTSERKYDEIVFMTPDGEVFEQKTANHLSLSENLMIICGHYKGLDERVRQHFITKEISIGDYVLSGGELAACVVTDAIIRLIPGTLNDETSALSDSFQDGLLSAPVYTRPAEFRGWKVPEVLLSGHEKNIFEWRQQQSIERTKKRRPDLLNEDDF